MSTVLDAEAALISSTFTSAISEIAEVEIVVEGVQGPPAPLDGTFSVESVSVSGTYAIPLTPAVVINMTGDTEFSIPSVPQGVGWSCLALLTGAFTPAWPVAQQPPYVDGGLYAITVLSNNPPIVKLVS